MTALHRSLALWFGGFAFAGTLLVSVPRVRAQLGYEDVPPATSAGQAAQRFAQLLASDRNQVNTGSLLYATVSRQELDELGYSATQRLLDVLNVDAKLPQFVASPPQKTAGGAVVEVRPSPRPAPLAVVCVQEKGAWRVSVLGTFARVRGLSQDKLKTAVFDLTGVALPGLPGRDRPSTQASICQNNLKELGLALLQYTQDYDERWPRASAWTDEIKPYARNAELFSCPSAKGGSGYAYNPNFSTVFSAQLSDADRRRVPVLYETSQRGFNATGTGSDVERRHSYERNAPPSQRSSFYVVPSGAVYGETINNPARKPPSFDLHLGPAPQPGPDAFMSPPPPAER